MRNFSAQKRIAHIVPSLIVLVIAGVAVWFFLNKGELGTGETTAPIPPSQLMPFVSAKEARTTICNLKKEGLFTQVCQNKFDIVGKDDSEKIVELFILIEEVKNDKNISDYERLLLSQAVFAALPIGDNHENSESFNFKQSLLLHLKDYLTSQITAYAQGQIISEEEFKDLMKKDLQNMIDDLSKKDNAWVINIMVSKYSWKDGKSQPLYSHQYMESFDPFPNNPNVNTKDITYHIQARVGSKASSQTVDAGEPIYKGTSEMIAYSFTIQSWKSQEYTSKEGGVDEQFLVRRRNRSDSSYQGEHYLTTLLDLIKLPSTKRPTEALDVEQKSNELKEIVSCEKLREAFKKCPYMVGSQWSAGSDMPDPMEFWCFFEPPIYDKAEGNSHFAIVAKRKQPPAYFMKLSKYQQCR